ncbi:MAG: putative LmbE-like protein [Pseudonocardiales bacterium]|nr:putative LmbE-like protein [Pseudonocardiales bacterium]
MKSFTHFEAGTPESHWQASTRLAAGPQLAVPSTLRLIVLAAHPDDETLAAGGLISTALAAEGQVTVIVASDGESSHPDSPSWTPTQLAAARREELVQAMAALSPTSDNAVALHFLGRPDGGLTRFEDEITADLRDLLPEVPGESSEWLATPWRRDGHPDHDTMGRIGSALAAARGSTLIELPIWFWHWGDDAETEFPWADLRRLELNPESLAAKTRAMAEHRTQVLPLSPAPGDEAILPPAMTAHFERAYESFIVSYPAA